MPYSDPEKQRAAQARYFQENKAKYAQKQRERRNLLRRYITEVKETTPCADCGINYPHYVMDFDHIAERGPKMFTIGMLQSVGGARNTLTTVEMLQAEIAKCDVVCSNCHRHRSWMRKKKDLGT